MSCGEIGDFLSWSLHSKGAVGNVSEKAVWYTHMLYLLDFYRMSMHKNYISDISGILNVSISELSPMRFVLLTALKQL